MAEFASRLRGAFAVERWGRGILRLLVAGLALIAWRVAAEQVASPIFPEPLVVFRRVRELWLSGTASTLFLTDGAIRDIGSSVARASGGWALGSVIGVVLGTVIALVRRFGDYVEPMVHFARSIPPPALVPLFIVLVGLGETMKVSVVVFGALWPVLLNTMDGVRTVDRVKIDAGIVFGLNWLQRVRTIVLPAAAPKIFAGLRISLSIAIILMVIAEMLGGGPGIGYEILRSQRRFQLLDMWASLVVLGALGYFFNAGLIFVESRWLHWHQRSG